MAITTETEPQDYNTASNPCVFTFSSDATANASFSFYVELTVNGSVHSYHTVFTESNNYGKFDCSDVLRSVVFSDLIVTGDYVNSYNSASINYSIRVQEKYGDPPALIGIWYASNTVNAFNGALRHQDWIDWDYQNYDATTQNNVTAEWLTDFPYKQQRYFCGLQETQFVSILCTDTSAQVIVTLYDVTGSTIATTTDAVTVPTANLMLLNISPNALIANTSLSTADFSTCYYYTVKFDATGGGAYNGFSKSFEVYIDTECTQYTTRRLHFLNKYGVWDAFTFSLYSEEDTKVKSSMFQTDKGVWSGSDTWDYNRYAGERKTYAKTSVDSMKLNSDWIKQAKQQWLVQTLYESPRVYLEVSYGVFELVNVKAQGFKLKQRIREGLIREEVTVERTYNYTSQLN